MFVPPSNSPVNTQYISSPRGISSLLIIEQFPKRSPVPQQPLSDSILSNMADGYETNGVSHHSANGGVTNGVSHLSLNGGGDSDGSDHRSQRDFETRNDGDGNIGAAEVVGDDENNGNNEDDEHNADGEVDAGRDNESSVYSVKSSTYTYCQEHFDTYQHKVAQLCVDIGFGKPEHIERMSGGAYNRIIGLRFVSGIHQECVLRVPRREELPGDSIEISDQISLLKYLSQNGFPQVPSVLAYDLTTNNALGRGYVLQERIPGLEIQKVFYDLSIAEKLEITTQVAEVITKLESTRMDRPGRVIGKRNFPPVSNTQPIFEAGIEIAGYRQRETEDKIEDQPLIPKQRLAGFLISLLETHANWWGMNGGPDLPRYFEEIKTIVLQMENKGFMRTSDVESVFWAWDLDPQDILIKPIEPAGIPPASGSHSHSVNVIVDDTSGSGGKHSVQVNIEGQDNKKTHTVRVEVEDSTGKSYRHTLEVNNTKTPIIAEESGQSPEAKSTEPKIGIHGSSPPKWEISGLLDWDDALSVPLVLARKPPSWLWCRDTLRSDIWNIDRDVPTKRELTSDELLIKAHFDQIMKQKSSSYIEDAYHRGPWLRRVAFFAIHGFQAEWYYDYQKSLVEDWKEYYDTLGP